MHPIDLMILVAYVCFMLGVGFFFLRRNESTSDYFVGGRKMSSLHVGLSVVATDVGGGFSIGLGGLGFSIGLSGSWMLFSGLLGAWLSAVFLIPRVKQSEQAAQTDLFTFPAFFELHFGKLAALVAAIISMVGYLGFTSSQFLAGAKLATAAFVGLDAQTALLIMGTLAVVYTAIGGIKAVIYTDTAQWIILMLGLFLLGIPLAYYQLGGWQTISSELKPEMLSLTNITWQTFFNWMITIVPIWFVAMTLYQRIYACTDAKKARRAWYIAGLFEWPVMAIAGVVLGMFAHAAAQQGMFVPLGQAATAAGIDPELGLPLLLRSIFPVGLLGLMIAAYLSAVLSTADSCLMAASGNLVHDFLARFFPTLQNEKNLLFAAKLATLGLGIIALALASVMENVLSMMLYSYAFMVSGLFVPAIVIIFRIPVHHLFIVASMAVGGTTTVVLPLLTSPQQLWGIDANAFGILASLITVGIGCIFAPPGSSRGQRTP